ncbi:MAG: 30S ribosomal protein S2 [Mycoplasmatales bacterium]
MAALTQQQLVEAGAHFGEAKRKWNPKMKQYIYTDRKGFHIIDLKQTAAMSSEFYEEIRSAAMKGDVLFVGTKKQASSIIKEQAEEAGMPYVSNRWLGGMLTNLNTIKIRIKRLEELEKLFESDDINLYTKKEQMLMKKEQEKLDRFLGGIRNMPKTPSAIFVIDSIKEHNAIKEAKKLGIKVIGVADTDSNPEDFDVLLPANDDAIKSINLIVSFAAEAAKEGKASK